MACITLAHSLKLLLVMVIKRMKSCKNKKIKSCPNANKTVEYVCSLVDMGEQQHQQHITGSTAEDLTDDNYVLASTGNNTFLVISVVIEVLYGNNGQFNKPNIRSLYKIVGPTVGAFEEKKVSIELLETFKMHIQRLTNILDDDIALKELK